MQSFLDAAPKKPPIRLFSQNTLHHFLISFLYAAHISAETVLVELLVGSAVPETAGVGRNFICKEDLTVESAELDLEVDKVNVVLLEELEHKCVNSKSILGDSVNFLLSSEAETESIVAVDEGIAEVIVLVAELESRLLERSALSNTELLGETACCNVSNDNFEGNDLDLLNDGLSVADLLNEVSGNAFLFKKLEHKVGHLVVDNALTSYSAFLFAVESGSIVLVVNDNVVGVVCSKNLLCLALVKLLALDNVFHSNILL